MGLRLYYQQKITTNWSINMANAIEDHAELTAKACEIRGGKNKILTETQVEQLKHITNRIGHLAAAFNPKRSARHLAWLKEKGYIS